MRYSLEKLFSTDLNKSLLATLIRYYPPIYSNEALIDIVNVLMDGLSRGDVYIDMKKIPENLELKYKDWPSYHMKALLESGWTKGDNSPIVLDGDLEEKKTNTVSVRIHGEGDKGKMSIDEFVSFFKQKLAE